MVSALFYRHRKRENSNLPTPIPAGDLIACHLTYLRFGVTVYVNKKQIFKMRPESFVGVYLSPDSEAQNHGLPPFIVFQARITPEFEIEQMGDGFPCNDEAHAKELMKTIEARNVTVPRVMMANWAGYFGLVTMTNFEIYSEGFQKTKNSIGVFNPLDRVSNEMDEEQPMVTVFRLNKTCDVAGIFSSVIRKLSKNASIHDGQQRVVAVIAACIVLDSFTTASSIKRRNTSLAIATRTALNRFGLCSSAVIMASIIT